ncbi:glycosyltransferase family 4 protein [Ornithinimicrobium sp. W1665]|uniref:glycosyltransferase family 4 protein n=1 Tax=Ornithinimicrobium sp. W1665 TaxID=3416666 RepID=UPI003CF8CED9
MDPSRMRIALVSSSYHPHFGGVEEHVRHVSKELLARGHAVEVWTVDRGDGLRDEVVDGCRVRYLPTPLPARSVRALGSLALRAPRALARWISAYVTFRPDVINVQCFGPNGPYGLALATMTRSPLVVSSHGETIMDEHSIYDRSALLRVSLRRAIRSGVVTACSDFVADDLRNRFGARDVGVVPNGVTPRRAIPDTCSPSGESGQQPVLMGAGRLVAQKGFDVLLRAAAQSRFEPTVWIVGEGSARSGLEQLAESLFISHRVHFLGRRTASEVQGLMARADAVVVPSRVEPFGIVVLEAWAAGTPVLATCRGGPAGFVTDGGDGLLIDPEDVTATAHRIDQVLADPALAERLRTEGLSTVSAYTWERVTDLYCWVYRTVLHPNGASPSSDPLTVNAPFGTNAGDPEDSA